jgi:signal transduction histidine kinase/sugar phosphate isomerase/epimerase
MLDAISAIGFEGVEIAQPIECLQYLDAESLIKAAEDRGLELLGLAGGSLRKRAEFIKRHRRAVYLYCERVGDEECEALRQGYRLALHPHAYKKVHRFDDAKVELMEHKDLEFLPDTAHSTIVGDDILASIFEFPKRLAAIHFKDWTPEYGRLSHRYAKGFKELGRGKVPPVEVLRELLRREGELGSRWIVYEQDQTQIGPEDSLRISAQWLAENGVPMRLSSSDRGQRKPWPQRLKESPKPEKEAKLARAIGDAAAGDYYKFYESLAKEVGEIYNAILVVVSACGESHGGISQMAVWPRQESALKIDEDDYLVTPTETAPEELALAGIRNSGLAQSAMRLNATHVLKVPILNSFNPNHTRMFVNVFVGPEGQTGLADIAPKALARHIGRGADANLDEFCTVAASKVSMAGVGSKKRERQSKSGFLEAVHDVIRDVGRASACSIFLLDRERNHLRVAYAPEIEWFGEARTQIAKQAYAWPGINLTTLVASRRHPEIIPDVQAYQDANPDWHPQSQERVGGNEGHTAMLIPMVDRDGECLGVVRCARTLSGSPFSDDDVAIVDTILQAAIPHLKLLQEVEDQDLAYAKLRHELKNPLVAIMNNLDNLKFVVAESKILGRPIEMKYDYLADSQDWAELAQSLVDRLRFIGAGPERLECRCSKVNLVGDVVAPLIRQMRSEFRENGLPERVEYLGLRVLPALYVDRLMFHQIFFNLVGNSIKYHDHKHRPFKLSIEAEISSDEFLVRVRDNGRGVEVGLEEAIFEEGFRGPMARAMNIEGSGFGLWVVRRVVEAHGGSVMLTRNQGPTEFTIHLPKTLAVLGDKASD